MTRKSPSSISVQDKQPKAIAYLFQTELWERFSYYGMTALLILYMSHFFHIGDKAVYALYGAYGALVYTTPILGGIIADRWLGPYRAVMLGGILIAIGHFLMVAVDHQHYFFFYGLSFIIVGTGLFKPNISTLIGQLYSADDSRRDKGFTYAYMGSNIGTIVAPIVASYIAVTFHWTWAFGVAGIGMLVGLVVLWRGRRHLNYEALAAYQYMTRRAYTVIAGVVIAMLLLVVLIDLAMSHPAVVGELLTMVIIFSFSLLLYAIWRGNQEERKRIIYISILIVFYICFMIMLQQSGGMLNIFTDRNVDRHLWHWTIPTGMFQSVEPLAVVILGPIYAWFWGALARRRQSISYPFKFSLSLLIMGGAFLILLLAIKLASHNGFINMWWINLSYLVQAMGELFIGPIGLAMVASLAPQRIIGILMGVWVLASAVANFAAAKVGQWMSPVDMNAMVHSPQQSIVIYGHMIGYLTLFSCIAGVILLMISPLLKHLANHFPQEHLPQAQPLVETE